jgi:hypothetical protein
MGVAWGIVDYSEKDDRAEVIASWKSLALDCYGEASFTIMHGADRIYFQAGEVGDRIEPVVRVTHDPEARARLDALSIGDGTYDLFDQLFDGFEVFVPWDTDIKIDAPGCVVNGRRAAMVGDLVSWMRGSVADDLQPDLDQLARWLLAAAEVARDLRMIIQISF